MSSAYRTLVIKRKVDEIPAYLFVGFLKVQSEFRKWAAEWYKSGFALPPPAELKYFAKELKYALKLIPVKGLKGEWKAPLPFNAQTARGQRKG